MKNIKKYVYNSMVLLLIVIGASIVIVNFGHFGHVEFTDNARVRQHVTPQNTRVQGFVKEVRFEEFQHVKKGDTLVVIEDTEFRLRLAQAQADLARAEEGSKATGSSIATTEAGMQVTDASIEEARAHLDNARREDARFEALLAKEAVTRQQYDNVHTAYLSAKARYEQAARSRATQTSVKAEQGHHLSASISTLRLAQAAVQLAQLNLSYCYIIATCDSVVGTKDIQEGMLVQPGQTLVNIVDAAACGSRLTTRRASSTISTKDLRRGSPSMPCPVSSIGVAWSASAVPRAAPSRSFPSTMPLATLSRSNSASPCASPSTATAPKTLPACMPGTTWSVR